MRIINEPEFCSTSRPWLSQRWPTLVSGTKLVFARVFPNVLARYVPARIRVRTPERPRLVRTWSHTLTRITESRRSVPGRWCIFARVFPKLLARYVPGCMRAYSRKSCLGTWTLVVSARIFPKAPYTNRVGA